MATVLGGYIRLRGGQSGVEVMVDDVTGAVVSIAAWNGRRTPISLRLDAAADPVEIAGDRQKAALTRTQYSKSRMTYDTLRVELVPEVTRGGR